MLAKVITCAAVVILIIIGTIACNWETSTNPAISPEPLAPALTPSPTPESVPTESKELPGPTINLPTAINEVAESTEVISINYSWTYRGNWSWDTKIPVSLYDYYRKLPRPPTTNYSVYVTHPLDDPYIDTLVEKIKNAAQQEGFSAYQTVEFAATFVQSLPYTVDSITTPYDEYPRYPIETLVDNGGDCEDTSILLASIIDEMGYGVVLLMLPNHVAVGVKGGEDIYGTYYDYEGSKYYYLETTGENWGIGKIPDEYKNASASISPMIPVPILSHDGIIESSGYIAEVEMKVSNLGTAPADNVTLFAGFDAGGGMVWNSQRSEPFELGASQQTVVRLSLKIPVGKHTRVVIQITCGGYVVDESYSEWFDT